MVARVSLADQAMLAVELARTRHPNRATVQAAADSVEAALGPVSWRDTRAFGSTSTCVDYTAGDASWWERTVTYRSNGCEVWVARLQAVMPALAAALRQAGDPGAAEVAESVGDSAEGVAEEQTVIVGSPGDWWAALPTPVKVGAVLVAALIVRDLARDLR